MTTVNEFITMPHRGDVEGAVTMLAPTSHDLRSTARRVGGRLSLAPASHLEGPEDQAETTQTQSSATQGLAEDLLAAAISETENSVTNSETQDADKTSGIEAQSSTSSSLENSERLRQLLFSTDVSEGGFARATSGSHARARNGFNYSGPSIREKLLEVNLRKPSGRTAAEIAGGVIAVGLAVSLLTTTEGSSNPKPVHVAAPMRADLRAKILDADKERNMPHTWRAETITIFDTTDVRTTADFSRTDNAAHLVSKGEVFSEDGVVPVGNGELRVTDLAVPATSGATDAETASKWFYIRDPDAPGVKTSATTTELKGFKKGLTVELGSGGVEEFTGTSIPTSLNPLRESEAVYKANIARDLQRKQQQEAPAMTVVPMPIETVTTQQP
jgi:hypothetical protein